MLHLLIIAFCKLLLSSHWLIRHCKILLFTNTSLQICTYRSIKTLTSLGYLKFRGNVTNPFVYLIGSWSSLIFLDLAKKSYLVLRCRSKIVPRHVFEVSIPLFLVHTFRAHRIKNIFKSSFLISFCDHVDNYWQLHCL